MAVAVLFLICVGFFWKLVLTDQYTWLESPDLVNQVLPWLQFQAREWHSGRIPLWDPYLWGGQTLIGQMITGAAYPFNWLLFLMPLKDGQIQQVFLHWYFVLIHFMAALFCYLLCRDLKRSKLASVVAGSAFALGGWVGVTDWPVMLNSAIWAPLVLLYLLRSLRGQRPMASAAASGAFLGLAWLGGHHQIPVFLMLATGGIWLYHILKAGRPDWRAVRLAAVFAVFLALVSGLQTLPAFEYGSMAKRWVNASEPVGWNEVVPYSVHSRFSLIPTSLLGIVVPGVSKYADPFMGVAALTLALLGVALAWKEFPVRLFAALGAGGLLFSLGRNNVLHGMLYAVVPMLEKARTPSMAIFIYHFGITVLIAYGIDTFLSTQDSQWPRRASLTLAAFGAVACTVFFALVVGQKPPGDDRFVVVALVALLLAGLLHAWHKGHIGQRTAACLALGLMLIEFGNVSGYSWPNREERDRTIYVRKLHENDDIARFLKNVPNPVRFDVSDSEIPYNFGDWYGIDQYNGFVTGLAVNLYRLPWHLPRARQLLGVNYTLDRKPPAGNQQLVFKGSSGLMVYENTDAFPRVWAVHQALQISKEAVAPTIIDPSFDLRQRTFLFQPPPAMDACPDAADTLRLIRRSSGRVTIDANMGCRGMVILSESYFPGWTATVDGERTGIYEAYGALRGVVVPRGRHRIEMRYIPASVIAGLLMTLSGALGAVFLTWRSRRKELAQ